MRLFLRSFMFTQSKVVVVVNILAFRNACVVSFLAACSFMKLLFFREGIEEVWYLQETIDR